MKCSVVLRNIRVSARKMRLVVDLVRNKNVEQALVILNHTNKKSAPIIKKLLQSAIANAVHNHSMNSQNLYIYEILANEGPTYKRGIFRAKGSSDRLLKRTTHLYITLSDDKNQFKNDLEQKKLKLANAKNKSNATKNEVNNEDVKSTSKKVEIEKGDK